MGTAFASMHAAARQYSGLPSGTGVSWLRVFIRACRRTATELAYSRGVLGASGIEILNLKRARPGC